MIFFLKQKKLYCSTDSSVTPMVDSIFFLAYIQLVSVGVELLIIEDYSYG